MVFLFVCFLLSHAAEFCEWSGSSWTQCSGQCGGGLWATGEHTAYMHNIYLYLYHSPFEFSNLNGHSVLMKFLEHHGCNSSSYWKSNHKFMLKVQSLILYTFSQIQQMSPHSLLAVHMHWKKKNPVLSTALVLLTVKERKKEARTEPHKTIPVNQKQQCISANHRTGGWWGW